MVVIVFILALFGFSFAFENLGTYGKVYPVEEEDLMEYIFNTSKKPVINFEETLNRRTVINESIPVATKDSVRKEKVIYTVPEDIVINGQVIARKGDKINVLERVKLSKTYVVLADYMIEDFLKYASDRTYYLVVSGDIRQLEMKYPDLWIFGGFKLILDALKVKRIPSVVYQENDYLVIKEFRYVKGGSVSSGSAGRSNRKK